MNEHYRYILFWFSFVALFWILGLIFEDKRELFWLIAILIDVTGTWLSHPLPNKKLNTRFMEFDVSHMIERCRLLFLISIGEVVLTTGTEIAKNKVSFTVVLLGILSFMNIVGLWRIYFSSTENLIDTSPLSKQDPFYLGRIIMNSQIAAVFSLVCLASSIRSSFENPYEKTTLLSTVIMYLGLLIYLLVQNTLSTISTSKFNSSYPLIYLLLVILGSLSLLLTHLQALILMVIFIAILNSIYSPINYLKKA